MKWNILYRGSLSSCNYNCGYCPFAKTSNTVPELRQDQREVERFTDWVSWQTAKIGILFTPWGEAFVHRYYREALVALSRMAHVYQVAMQTNLSAPIDDLLAAERSSLALWATFHPSQITLERFVDRCRELDAADLRYSVGAVGLREHFPAIARLRELLRPEVYLWINAFKQTPHYYEADEIQRLAQIDPYFHLNLPEYPSFGKPCSAGASSFSVDGSGNMRRCHFIKDIIGNIYEPGFAECLQPQACIASHCGCYIGYIHRPELQLEDLYGNGLLPRIPADWPRGSQSFLAGFST